MKAILLDIEGTTTPIDFVHKTLFPFAKERIAEFVREHLAELNDEIAELKTEHATDDNYAKEFDEGSPDSVAEYLKFLIDIDRKSTPLKSIQGKIWQQGYESGELLSEIFEDVPRAFERWKSQNKTIVIYSSGSILAQKLLFKYTNHGDLTKYISSYFDTNIGGKRDVESYRNIASALGFDPGDILFISDILAELDAAAAAGYQVALSIREGNAEIEDDFSYQAVQNFDELSYRSE
jgi:enolase-phosphatase E1